VDQQEDPFFTIDLATHLPSSLALPNHPGDPPLALDIHQAQLALDSLDRDWFFIQLS
jgi:hypothetical protein